MNPDQPRHSSSSSGSSSDSYDSPWSSTRQPLPHIQIPVNASQLSQEWHLNQQEVQMQQQQITPHRIVRQPQPQHHHHQQYYQPSPQHPQSHPYLPPHSQSGGPYLSPSRASDSPRGYQQVKRSGTRHPSQQLPQQPMRDLQHGGAGGVDQKKKANDSMATSEFVTKLFNILEDSTYEHVVSWGPKGDCFVVKDLNEFTKSILPKMFKHSNFASFVRQLNKYDFHKVKSEDDERCGEQTWTFRHPHFTSRNRNKLALVRRKLPAPKPSTPTPAPAPALTPAHLAKLAELQQSVMILRGEIENFKVRVMEVEKKSVSVMVAMEGLKRDKMQQELVLQYLVVTVFGSGGVGGGVGTGAPGVGMDADMDVQQCT